MTWQGWARLGFVVFLVLWFIVGPNTHADYGRLHDGFMGWKAPDEEQAKRVLRWTVRPLCVIGLLVVGVDAIWDI